MQLPSDPRLTRELLVAALAQIKAHQEYIHTLQIIRALRGEGVAR